MRSSTAYLLWATVGFAIQVIGFLWIRRKWKSNEEVDDINPMETQSVLPTFTNAKVGEVQHIYLYAIDGGHPIEVEKANCIGAGLQYRKNRSELPLEDRSFVVYTADSKEYYSESSKLLTILLKKTNVFELETTNGEEFLKMEDSEINRKEFIPINYLSNTIMVYDCGDRAAKFLSMYLLNQAKGLRLGQFVVKLIRKHLNPNKNITDDPLLDQPYLLKSMKPEFNNFSLISDKTINYIKGLHGCGHVKPKHFRAHIVIGLSNGTEAWQRPFIEDHFVEVRIGSASFANVTLRTIEESVNINPETGIPSCNVEPFKTLKSLRQAQLLSEKLFNAVDTPLLGINMEIQQTGVIRVGDDVNVQFKDINL